MTIEDSRRVLLLATNLGIGGGAEEQVIQLALRLRQRGWAVEIVSMLEPGTLPDDLAAFEIPVHSLHMRRGIADPFSLFRLAREIRRFRPRVLHTHMTHANILGRAARAIAPVPALISTLHGLKMYRVNGGPTRGREYAHQITDRWADLTTTICRAGADSYIRDHAVPAKKLIVVPNGVDTTEIHPDPGRGLRIRRELGLEPAFVWLAVGRLEKPKAYGTMMRAFARACQIASAPPVLLVCGQGSLEAQVRQQARELGIAEQVRFLGVRRDVPALMSAADAFLMSSDTEGLPMALLQATACALPAVATSVGGIPEIVENGKSGFLVEAGDPDRLAAAMDLMANVPSERRRAMGAAGRTSTCANFDLDRVVSRWEQLYASVSQSFHTRKSMNTTPSRSGIVQSSAATAASLGAHRTIRSCVPERFRAQAADTPEDTAVTSAGEAMTYEQLNQRSNQLARHLMSLGAGPEVAVGIYMERSPAFVTAALAILKAGAAYVPLDPAWPPERVHQVLTDSNAPVLVTHRWMAAGLPAGGWSTVDIDIDRKSLGRYPAEDFEPAARPDNLAYIIYTSGSTGVPKGVEITHASLSNLVAWHQRTFRITPADRASQVAGLGFDAAVWELWPYLTAGASVHFADEISRRSPQAMREFLLDRDINIGFVPTVMAEELMRLDWPRNASLRTLLTGADTLHRHPDPSLPFTLINNYGPTECTVVASSGIVPTETNTDRMPSIGRPIANTEIYILDENLQPVEPGEAGELCIGGLGLARGYRNLPELTARKFVRLRLAGPLAERVFRTGDRARYLANGDLEFLGRMDDQIKIRGFRIEPDGIVACLDRHPEVRNSAVIARDDMGAERVLVAYVAVAAGSTVTGTELREFLSVSLPEYMIPSAFVRMSALPTTTNGKCDKAALPTPVASNMLRNETRGTAASNAVEQRITEIVTSLVNAPEVGRDDNFFLIGGHSMLAAQLLVSVRESFGVSVTLRELFEAPTVASLSAKIERLIASK
jgi:amino acid adenylation domain-containing protein